MDSSAPFPPPQSHTPVQHTSQGSIPYPSMGPGGQQAGMGYFPQFPPGGGPGDMSSQDIDRDFAHAVNTVLNMHRDDPRRVYLLSLLKAQSLGGAGAAEAGPTPEGASQEGHQHAPGDGEDAAEVGSPDTTAGNPTGYWDGTAPGGNE
jgi:hypothetical protein